MAPVQEDRETAATDLADLLDAVDGAGVTLVAGDTHLVAHRAVLAARSSVFEAIFCRDTPEARSGLLTVPDVEGKVLRHLVAYCYTLQAPQLPSMAPQLLVAADKYGLPVLKAECEAQVTEQLAVETAASAAVLALKHSCASLKQEAITYIKAYTHQVMATQGWADAVRADPDVILEVSRLVGEPPAGASTAAAASGGSAVTRHQAEDVETPAADAALAPPDHTPRPEDERLTGLKRLPAEEKNRRLILASKEGATDALRTLLAAGASVEAKDWFHRTALHFAAMRGHVEAVRSLLESGAKVDARTSKQHTPLHCAALNGHTVVVQLLTASSADPNARNADGRTPLHCAAYWGYAQTVAALLYAGADKAARDAFGLTPLDLARIEKEEQVVRLLR